MRNRGLIVALLSCVFALSLMLVGCGGGSTGGGDTAKKAFTGTWDLVEMSQDGEVTNSDDLETLKALGMEVYVNLNEDGTAVLVLFGEALEGSWEASSATAGSIDLNGQKVNMTLDGSKLKFEQEGASLVFEKGEAKQAPSTSSSSSAGSSSSSSSAS